jgi:hypothetical protein
MDGGGFCSSIRKFKGNPLDVVDHGEYFGFVNAGRITFWWKNRETDAPWNLFKLDVAFQDKL